MFNEAKATIAALLAAHPDAELEDIRTKLASHNYDSRTFARAWAAVKRETAAPVTRQALERLHEAGVHIPPAMGLFPDEPEPRSTWEHEPRTAWPSDEGSSATPDAFVAAFDKVASAYERNPKARTRDIYYEHLMRVEGCTLDEIADAVPLLLRTKGTWPRIADWYAAIIIVRERRRARSSGQRPPLRVGLHPDGLMGAIWDCERCRDDGWRPACGCSVGQLVNGHCELHPRIEHGTDGGAAGIHYRPRYVRCECGQQAVAL